MTTISQRLLAVAGHNQCANDVIFVQKQTSTQPASVVVFFGGDVQVKNINKISMSTYFASLCLSITGLS